MRGKTILAVCALAIGLVPAAAAAGTPDRARSATMHSSAALLAQFELALDALGYRIDPPDGIPDARTNAALTTFLTHHELPAVTQLSWDLVGFAWAAAELQRRDRLLRAGLRRKAEHDLVRADLAKPSAADIVAADPSR